MQATLLNERDLPESPMISAKGGCSAHFLYNDKLKFTESPVIVVNVSFLLALNFYIIFSGASTPRPT